GPGLPHSHLMSVAISNIGIASTSNAITTTARSTARRATGSHRAGKRACLTLLDTEPPRGESHQYEQQVPATSIGEVRIKDGENEHEAPAHPQRGRDRPDRALRSVRLRHELAHAAQYRD